ncbi:uncharacterized protein LOC127761238 [Oryza glaberrima]|uniref:At1g61320/AtMIF1 LRR domain-containing protein n=1 Tax=Oryza barthii TaxID=65489 RepID=A0A0D3EQK0_9ORYZ|nr:uncharacterized protein LOC127761238 [Oryza glaberrima]
MLHPMELLPRPSNQRVAIAGEDRISELPDDVLVSILEKLGNTRQAVATSVLSRRWLHLPWRIRRPFLSIFQFLPRSARAGGEDGLKNLQQRDLDRAIPPFVRAAMAFLASPTATHCLALRFLLTDEEDDELVYAVRHLLLAAGAAADAGGGGTRRSSVQLDVRATADTTEAQMRDGARRRLLLTGLVARPRGLLITKLRLERLWLTAADVAAVLGACARLVHLTLHGCRAGRGEGAALAIDGAPELRELVVRGCGYRRVELRRAPKLVRLTLESWSSTTTTAPLRLAAAPCLREISLVNSCTRRSSQRFRLSELLASATNLDCLSLNFRNEEIWIQPEDSNRFVAAFGRLTTLSLCRIFDECDLLWTLYLLKAAPSLRKFSIGVQKHSCQYGGSEVKQRQILFPEKRNMFWIDFNFQHYHLAQLEICGFEANDKYMIFTRLIMEQAKNLKVVILSDEKTCDECDFQDDGTSSTGSSYPKNKEEKRLIQKQLTEGISSPVRVLVL